MRYSLHDGPGIRTTVFLKGCPLSCWWCHNPECQEREREWAWQPERCRLCEQCVDACPHRALSRQHDSICRDAGRCKECGGCVEACLTDACSWLGRLMTPEEVLGEVLKDRMFYEESEGGVTFSGGEPLMQPSFLEAVLRLCREQDLHTVVDTSGYAPQAVLQRITPWVDLFLFDLKVIDEQKHQEYTGVSNAPILANLQWLLRENHPVLVSIPIIPDLNDGDSELDQMGEFLANTGARVKVRLLPYHATGAGKYRHMGREYRLDKTVTPGPERLKAVSERLEAHGIDAKAGDD